MKFRRDTIVLAALVALVAEPALARVKSNPHARCVDRPDSFSWNFLLPGHPEPQPNGCAPPVYAYGKYIGQDPDPNIRFQLLRDPATGYSAHQN